MNNLTKCLTTVLSWADFSDFPFSLVCPGVVHITHNEVLSKTDAKLLVKIGQNRGILVQ